MYEEKYDTRYIYTFRLCYCNCYCNYFWWRNKFWSRMAWWSIFEVGMVLGNLTQYQFTPNDIPLFSAIMTTIAGFFKSVKYNNKNN